MFALASFNLNELECKGVVMLYNAKAVVFHYHTVPLQGRKRPGLPSRNDGGSKILLFFYIEKCIQNLISTSYQGLNF